MDILKNKENCISHLCVLLIVNWLYNSFSATSNSESFEISSFTGQFIVYLIIYAIWYIPNIMYFSKRETAFVNLKKNDNTISNNKKITLEELKSNACIDDVEKIRKAELELQKVFEKNSISEGTRTPLKDLKIPVTSPTLTVNTIDDIEEKYTCKVCGKSIEYNENGTCEECHKKILERIEKKNTKYIECKVCGKEIPYNEKNICGECEKKLLDKLKEPEKRFCTKCGREIKSEWEFCNYCGNKLK